MNYQPRPLLEDEQATFQANVLSLAGETANAKRQTTRLAWCSSAIFALFGLVGIASYVMLLPYLQKLVSNHYILVDQIHGYVQEVTPAEDAPRFFGPRVAEAQAKAYIELWMEYSPDTDAKHYALVQALSGEDQRARYIAWHNTNPTAPPLKLLRKGSVDTFNYLFYPLNTPKDGTQEYRVNFQRRETYDGIVGPTEQWSSDIQFHWEPALLQTDQQVQNNPSGLVVTFFEASKQ